MRPCVETIAWAQLTPSQWNIKRKRWLSTETRKRRSRITLPQKVIVSTILSSVLTEPAFCAIPSWHTCINTGT